MIVKETFNTVVNVNVKQKRYRGKVYTYELYYIVIPSEIVKKLGLRPNQRVRVTLEVQK